MNEESIKIVYKELKNEIEQIMNNKNIDFCSMSKIMHKLAQDFDSSIKHRYP